MGVLESMRSSSDSTFMQVVLVLVIVSFIGWYATPKGNTTNVIAVVNGERILGTEYRQAFSQAKYRLERRNGGEPLSNAEEKTLGEQVRQEMIRATVVRQKAEEIGLEVSGYERYLLKVRSGQAIGFADESGVVDEEKYQRFLKQRGLTEGRYEQQLARELMSRKMSELITSATTISGPILRKLYEQSQRKVDLSFVRIRPSAFYSAVSTTDEEIATWLTENSDRAQELFDRDFETKYKHPEKLRISMIRLKLSSPDDAADMLPRLNELRQLILDGADFGEVARKYSEHASAEKNGDMGLKSVLTLNVEITEAVKDLKIGEVSRVVNGDNDLRLYKVQERVEPFEETFEQVKASIARDAIRKEKAPALAAAFAEEELLPKWKEAKAAPLDLVASKTLSVQHTGMVTVSGRASLMGPPSEVLAAAGDLPEGTVIPEVFEVGGVYWVAQVSGKQEANLADFEAQRQAIQDQELMGRRQQVYEGWVTDAVAKADVE